MLKGDKIMSEKHLLNPSKVEGLGDLIDSSDEVFMKHFEDKDLGYLLSVSKLFNLTYEQLINMEKDLLALKPKTEIVVKHISSLYYYMNRIEHKASLLNAEIKNRQVNSI